MDELEEYSQSIESKWQQAYFELAKVIEKNIPEGFVLKMQYGMPTYVVPLETFPEGYLNRTYEPLPFISLAAQKNHLSLYHMGLIGNKDLLNWFQEEYKKQVPTKLNMGKSCIRFSNPKHIPYSLIGELVRKISVEEWIKSYVTFSKNTKRR